MSNKNPLSKEENMILLTSQRKGTWRLTFRRSLLHIVGASICFIFVHELGWLTNLDLLSSSSSASSSSSSSSSSNSSALPPSSVATATASLEASSLSSDKNHRSTQTQQEIITDTLWPAVSDGEWVEESVDYCRARENTTAACFLGRYQWRLSSGSDRDHPKTPEESCENLQHLKITDIFMIGDSMLKHVWMGMVMTLTGNTNYDFARTGPDCIGDGAFNERNPTCGVGDTTVQVCARNDVATNTTRFVNLSFRTERYRKTGQFVRYTNAGGRALFLYGVGNQDPRRYRQKDDLAGILNSTYWIEHRWAAERGSDNVRRATGYLDPYYIWIPPHYKLVCARDEESNERAERFMQESAAYFLHKGIPTLNTFTLTQKAASHFCRSCKNQSLVANTDSDCQYHIRHNDGQCGPPTRETLDGYHYGRGVNIIKANLALHYVQHMIPGYQRACGYGSRSCADLLSERPTLQQECIIDPTMPECFFMCADENGQVNGGINGNILQGLPFDGQQQQEQEQRRVEEQAPLIPARKEASPSVSLIPGPNHIDGNNVPELIWPPIGDGEWVEESADYCRAHHDTTSACFLGRYRWKMPATPEFEDLTAEDACKLLYDRNVTDIYVIGDSLMRHTWQGLAIYLSGDVRFDFVGRGEQCLAERSFSEKLCRVGETLATAHVCPRPDGSFMNLSFQELSTRIKPKHLPFEVVTNGGGKMLFLYGAGNHPSVGIYKEIPRLTILNATSWARDKWSQVMQSQHFWGQGNYFLWIPPHFKMSIGRADESNARAFQFLHETAEYFGSKQILTLNTFTLTQKAVPFFCRVCGVSYPTCMKPGANCRYFIRDGISCGAPTVETWDGYHYGLSINVMKARLVLNHFKHRLFPYQSTLHAHV